MTRIVGGEASGRRLRVPPAGTRPTSERVREAVFSAVGHRLGGWHGVVVLDLFAGSGAMGLEAASRGADRVVLVEADRTAARVVRSNIEAVAPTVAEVWTVDAWRLGEPPPEMPPVDLLILDPPYRDPADRIAALVAGLTADGWCAPEALAVLERPAREPVFTWPQGWEQLTDRRYGDTRILLGTLVASQ